VTFWTELLTEELLNKATFWSHRFKNSTVVMTIWLIYTKYLYLEWQLFLFRFM
jgi:hypothetical protein